MITYISLIVFFGTFFIYLFVEKRDFLDAYYGSCVLVSSQGQDDKPETDSGKVFISLFTVLSYITWGVWVWIIVEDRIQTKWWSPLLLITFTSTFLIYILFEERNFIDSLYGTVMLLTLNGQDDKPETSVGMFFLGTFSLISAYPLNVCLWNKLEPLYFYISRRREQPLLPVN